MYNNVKKRGNIFRYYYTYYVAYQCIGNIVSIFNRSTYSPNLSKKNIENVMH